MAALTSPKSSSRVEQRRTVSVLREAVAGMGCTLLATNTTLPALLSCSSFVATFSSLRDTQRVGSERSHFSRVCSKCRSEHRLSHVFSDFKIGSQVVESGSREA